MVAAEKFWNGIADKYSGLAIPDPEAYEATLARVRPWLNTTDSLLELGCGTGTTALKLAGCVGRITASDIASEMVRIGADKARDAGVETIEFARGGIADMAARGEQYDVVTAFNLLHLLDDLPGALADIHAMVRPGGLFISKTFCRPGPGQSSLQYRAMRILVPVMQLVGKAPFVAFMPIPELEAAIRAAGFEVLETGNYPERPPRRLIVARKPG